MNPFLDIKSVQKESPQRMYARVDSVESLDPEGAENLIYAAGVDAGWFDNMIGPYLEGDKLPPSALEKMDEAPIAITEFILERDEDPEFGKLGEFAQPGNWLKIERTYPGLPATQYASLFGPPTQVNVSIEHVRREFARKLDSAFSLPQVPDEPRGEIEDRLRRAGLIDFIAVMDVGQGNACGLWRGGSGAALYFDVGGGVLTNARTFPDGRVKFCLSQTPAIVLSHWDWDHWSSAMRFPELLDCWWLAPRQQLDPIHLAFAWQLFQKRSLHVWPDAYPSISGGLVRLERCRNGKTNDKNNNGLALTIATHSPDQTPIKFLLPGDADFDSIPSVNNGEAFDGLVASHHGANVKAIGQLKSTGNSGPLVYSVGHGNGYGHPRLNALLEYLQAGWLPPRTYSTTQSRRNRPCTIGIRLNRTNLTTGCPQCRPRIWS